MNDLSPEARRALAQAKSGQPRASQAMRARVKQNVLRAVAVAPADAAGANDLTQGSFAKLPAWTWPSLGALAVIGGIATFAAPRSASDVVPMRQPSAARLQVPSQREATLDRRAADDGLPDHDPRQDGAETQTPAMVSHETSTAATVIDDNIAAARATRRARARDREQPLMIVGQASREPATAPTRDQDASLRAEMELLARAEAALRNKEPESALSILDLHAQQHRRGQLQDEGEGLRLIARCTLGRDPQRALTHYLHDHAEGVLQSRIRTSCASFLK